VSQHAGSREQGAGGAWPLPPTEPEPGKIALHFGMVTFKFSDRDSASRFLGAVRHSGAVAAEELDRMEHALEAFAGGAR
jgi:hypothetical protein